MGAAGARGQPVDARRRRLAERARIPLEYEQGGAEQQSRGLKEKLLEIHEQITSRWLFWITRGPVAIFLLSGYNRV